MPLHHDSQHLSSGISIPMEMTQLGIMMDGPSCPVLWHLCSSILPVLSKVQKEENPPGDKTSAQ